MNRSLTYRLLAALLAVALGGVPQLAAQTQQPAPEPQQQPAQPQQPNITADPAQGPIEPVPSTTQQEPEEETPGQETLPAAPSTQAQQPAAQQPQSTSKPQEPAGTAAAGEAATVGGAASKPAGTAIAPAKQKQVRSLLIKLGAIAAAGAAIGIVYGLSKGTSSRPPGAATTATPAP